MIALDWETFYSRTHSVKQLVPWAAGSVIRCQNPRELMARLGASFEMLRHRNEVSNAALGVSTPRRGTPVAFYR